MNFLKRATPWMITLVILLGLYVTTFFWYYKPKFANRSLYDPFPYSTADLLFQFYKPMLKWEEERYKQSTRKELLSQCQGEWQGQVRPRSENLTNHNQPIKVRATIAGDQFKITQAESMPELVGATWKIGSELDAYPRLGIFTNNYPTISSIFLSYDRSPSGEETLNEGIIISFTYGRAGNAASEDDEIVVLNAHEKQLVRPAAPPTPSN